MPVTGIRIDEKLPQLKITAPIPIHIIAVNTVLPRGRAEAIHAHLPWVTKATDAPATVGTALLAIALLVAAIAIAVANLRIGAAGLGANSSLTDAGTEDAGNPIPTLTKTTQSATTIFTTLITLTGRVATFQDIGANLIRSTAGFATGRPGALAESAITNDIETFALAAGSTASVGTAVLAAAVGHANTLIARNGFTGIAVGGRETNTLLTRWTVGHVRGPHPALILNCTTSPLLSAHAPNGPFDTAVTWDIANTLFAGTRFGADTTLTTTAVPAALLALAISCRVAAGGIVADFAGSTESTILQGAPAALGCRRLTGLACIARIHRSRRRTGTADFTVDLLHHVLALTLGATVIGALQTVIAGATATTAAVITTFATST